MENITNITTRQTLTRNFSFLNKFSRAILKEDGIRPVKRRDGTYDITFPVGTVERNIQEEQELLTYYYTYVLPSGKKLHYFDNTLTYLGE